MIRWPWPADRWRVRPKYSASIVSTATCEVNALVLATPTSGPACRYTPPHASRAMLLPTALQIASVVWPIRLLSRSAASVSAVSPDCVIASTTVSRATGGLR